MRDGTVWERRRAAVREEIARIAIDMFTAQGFDNTTIDQIVAAAGISRRSFFRYFCTKEDIVLGDLVARGRVVADELEARPVDEKPWDSMRAAFEASLPKTMPDSTTALELGRMLLNTPALQARLIEKRRAWLTLFIPILAERIQLPPQKARLRAAAIATASMACLDLATEEWVAAGGSVSLAELYDQAVGAIREDD